MSSSFSRVIILGCLDTPTVGRYYLEGRDVRPGLADGTVTEGLKVR